MRESRSQKQVPFFLVWGMVIVWFLALLAYAMARREASLVPETVTRLPFVAQQDMNTSWHLVGKGAKTYLSIDIWYAGGSGASSNAEFTKVTLDGKSPAEKLPLTVMVPATGMSQNFRFEFPTVRPDRSKTHQVELEFTWKSGSSSGGTSVTGDADFW